MGIQLGSEFDVIVAQPIDSRMRCADLTARDAIPAGTRYEGMQVYVESDETTYRLTGGIADTDWEPLVAGEALPDQTGQNGKYLRTDGTTATWEPVAGGGGGKNYFDPESADFEGGTIGNWGAYRDAAFVNYTLAEASNSAVSNSVGFFGADRVAQKVELDSEIITSVDFVMVRFPSPDGTVRCELRKDNAGVPGTEVLFTSANVNMSSVPTGSAGTVTFTFTGANRLTGTYWIVVRSQGETVAGSVNCYDEPQVGNLNILRTLNSEGTWSSAARTFAGTVNTSKREAAAQLSLAVSTANPLAGTTSLELTKAAANAQNEYISCVLPNIDRLDPRTQFFAMGYDATSANYAAEDIQLEFYQYPTGERLYSGPDSDNRLLKASTSIRGLPVYLEQTTGAVEVFARVRTTNAAAYTVYFDEFRLGPAASVNAAIVTPWETFTPTFQNAGGWTITSSSKKRRVGDNMEVTLSISITGSGTGAGTFTMNVPDGLTVQSGVTAIGPYLIFDFQNNNIHLDSHAQFTGSGISFIRPGTTGSLAPNDFTNTAYIRANFSIPIAEWTTGSNVLTTNELGVQTGAFRASRNGVNQTGVNPNNSNVKILINSVSGSGDYTKGLTYDTANSRFVNNGPSGIFKFDAAVNLQGTNLLAARYRLDFNVSGLGIVGGPTTIPSAGLAHLLTNSVQVFLPTGATVEVELFGAGNNSVNTLTVVAASTSFAGSRLPDFTVLGAVRERNKVQTKVLASNVTSDGVISSLTFNNLVVGKCYEFMGQFRCVANSSATDISVAIIARHNSVDIAAGVNQNRQASSTSVAGDIVHQTVTGKFKAAATTLTFVSSSATANSFIAGNGTNLFTFVQLEERNDLMETTDFT